MAHAPAAPTSTHDETAAQHPPITPGKFAMWLFLATEVMFFTGLIGSYIVLRTGSPPTSYSNIYSPGTDFSRLDDTKGVSLEEVGGQPDRVAEILHNEGGLTEHDAHHTVEHAEGGGHHLALGGMPEKRAEAIVKQLEAAGAKAGLERLHPHKWPVPYDEETNPLSINLTAANTFILICSSVTMVLALSAIQRGDKKKLTLFLLATTLIGSCFLGVQVYEYYQLMFGHYYPIGISATHHFRPDASLFASCFFTMTGFHGAHVAGGVVMMSCILIGSLLGKFTAENHSTVELIGLYWHFVDLVWIILFTVVYLI